MKRLRLFERRLNLQFADLITGTVGGSVGSGWVGSFLSFLLLSLKPPPQFCRFFYWFALRRQSFFCHHSHLFFCKHQAWQRKPVQICGGGKKSLIFFIAMKYFFSQNLARIFVWWFFLGHQPWSDLGTMHAFTMYSSCQVNYSVVSVRHLNTTRKNNHHTTRNMRGGIHSYSKRSWGK